MRILAVDDDPDALNILDLALQTAGYDEIDLVQSAIEALDYLDKAETPYDCLLLDILMPGMDGVELCRHVRDMPQYAHVPIIMITASQHKETLTNAIISGATDYVNKPFDGLELVTRLRAAESLTKATKAANANGSRKSTPSRRQPASILQISDALALDERPGVVSQADLVCEFMEAPQFLQSIHLFAVAVADIKSVFDSLPGIEFRAFINELAASLSQTTRTWGSRISYVGDGAFVVALYDVGFLSSVDLHRIIKTGIAACAFESLACFAGETCLCVDYVGVSDPDHYMRVDALFRAAENAKRKAANRMSAEREIELRHHVLGRARRDANTYYELALTKGAPRKIVPRRPSRQGKCVAAKGEEGSVVRRKPENTTTHVTSDG